MEATLLSVPCMFWFLSLIIIFFFFLEWETPRDRIVWDKMREIRSANLFRAFSRCQTGNHLSGKKRVSVQDGAATGRKLVKLTCVFVSVFGRGLVELTLVCRLGDDSSVCLRWEEGGVGYIKACK